MLSPLKNYVPLKILVSDVKGTHSVRAWESEKAQGDLYGRLIWLIVTNIKLINNRHGFIVLVISQFAKSGTSKSIQW